MTSRRSRRCGAISTTGAAAACCGKSTTIWSLWRAMRSDVRPFLVGLVGHGADVQDRNGAPEVLKSIATTSPLLRHSFADGGDGRPKLRRAPEKIGRWTIQIVKRSDTATGFEVTPRRWVVARTFAWLGRCRRMAKHRGENHCQRRGMAAYRPHPPPYPPAGKAMTSFKEF